MLRKGFIMNITDETIEYVAKLAKLELKEEEKEKTKEDLEKILGYIDSMNELNTNNIEPLSQVIPLKNVFREDIVTNQENRQALLSNAPVQKEECFVVPKTVE